MNHKGNTMNKITTWIKTNWRALLFNLLLKVVDSSALKDIDGNYYYIVDLKTRRIKIVLL